MTSSNAAPLKVAARLDAGELLVSFQADTKFFGIVRWHQYSPEHLQQVANS